MDGRRKTDVTDGKNYWRSLKQLANTPDFQESLHREFPEGTVELNGNNWSRRSFLTTMGASIALASLAGCRRPVEKIVPYVTRPEEIDPGVPNHYATSYPTGTGAVGILVTSREGRPIKIEGNPMHRSSQGGVSPWVTASILDLYDPDRVRYVHKKGERSTLAEFETFWAEEAAIHAENDGAELAVLAMPGASPTYYRLREAFLRKYPRAHWGTWEPINDEAIADGTAMAVGKSLQPVHYFARARIVCALDADFLGTETEHIANARGFAEARKVRSQQDNMCRLYAAEAALSVTGAMADHRLRWPSGRITALAAALTAELTTRGLNIPGAGSWTGDMRSDDLAVERVSKWVSAVADDLLAARGQSLVVAGRRQPAALHALVMAINDALGNTGETVRYYSLPDRVASSTTSMSKTVDQLLWEKKRTVIVLGGNPAHGYPIEYDGRAALLKTPIMIQLGTHANDSTEAARWLIPQAHYLESWGDVRAVDGTLGVIQPMIDPLHGGKSDIEFLNYLTTGEWRSGYDLVRETWQYLLPNAGFEQRWERVLHDGLLEGSALEPERIRLDSGELVRLLSKEMLRTTGKTPTAEALEVGFYPSSVWDGRFANNGWLQEMPDAMTKLAWDNAALIAPATARALGIENGDMLQVGVQPYSTEIAAWIAPGQAENTLALPLGYGRTTAGRLGSNVGFRVEKIRRIKQLHYAADATVTRLGRTYQLVSTQDHGSMEGRPIVRENTLAGYKQHAEFYPTEPDTPPLIPLWQPHSYEHGYQWGMTIDLNTCIGCNACVVACQSENNIPIVGKEQVGNGREMHWMRLDRYYAGDIDDPEIAVQPMNCQHCENAPCEQVCPVAATVHDDEGINAMVYNRCIGTRYCSNNCPFKVRRFNFFNYTNNLSDEHKMVQNPEVTVRFRGVMEKCTYCLHRININKHKAKVEGRTLTDGEVVTACQQACPTKAIVFGNINDPESQVAKLRKNDRAYQLLREYNLKTRTSYLAKLRNPHPSLARSIPGAGGAHGKHGGSGHDNGNSEDHG